LTALLLIYLLSFPPITRSENPDAAAAPSETNCDNTTADFAKAEVTLFDVPVLQIFRHHSARVEKGFLRLAEGNTVLGLIGAVLRFIPFEARLAPPYGICTILLYGLKATFLNARLAI